MPRPKADFPAPEAIRARIEGIELGEGVVLGIATSRLQLLRGATGRDKLVRLID